MPVAAFDSLVDQPADDGGAGVLHRSHHSRIRRDDGGIASGERWQRPPASGADQGYLSLTVIAEASVAL
jgi:hypothetical protein